MLSVAEIASQIEAQCDRLEELVQDIRTAGVVAARSEATFRATFAKARLEARAEPSEHRKTADQVTDEATAKTEDERLDYLLAANDLTVLREALRATQARLDALRTLSASFRTAGG